MRQNLTNPPTGNLSQLSFIRYWVPQGSKTVLFVKNMDTGRIVNLLRWGNKIYLPVSNGEDIGIGVYNGHPHWVAYPTYIEGANLWVGGPSEPEDCGTDAMWELRSGDTSIFSHLVDPNSQSGRPLRIVVSGTGFAIGESTFQTDKFRGQIRVYERYQIASPSQQHRPTNRGIGATRDIDLERGTSRGFGIPKGSTAKGADESFIPQSAAIGAGETEYVPHVDTGITYRRQSEPVISLNVEYRDTLQGLIAQKQHDFSFSWWSDVPLVERWWDQLSQDEGLAPHIPQARKPHEGRE